MLIEPFERFLYVSFLFFVKVYVLYFTTFVPVS